MKPQIYKKQEKRLETMLWLAPVQGERQRESSMVLF